MPTTVNAVPTPPGCVMVPADCGEPSPQSIVAEKSLSGAVGLPSRNRATGTASIGVCWKPLTTGCGATAVKAASEMMTESMAKAWKKPGPPLVCFVTVTRAVKLPVSGYTMSGFIGAITVKFGPSCKIVPAVVWLFPQMI